MKSNLLKTALFLLCFFPFTRNPLRLPSPSTCSRRSCKQISSGVSADWGIYIKSIDTGEEIAINADNIMDTMSAIRSHEPDPRPGF